MWASLSKKIESITYHRHAQLGLFLYAIVESVIFPIPPDVILIPMSLMRPKKAVQFATIAAIGSVVGGIAGYMIGRYAFQPVARPVLEFLCNYQTAMCPDTVLPRIEALFAQYGWWIIAVSAMSPLIPYRFTILAAGLAKMALGPFIIISLVVHWLRYATICWCVARFGQSALDLVKTRLPAIFTGISIVVLVIFAAKIYF